MIVSIWQPNLIDAHSFIRDNQLEEFFVQFLKDDQMKSGYYIVFNKMPGPSVFDQLLTKYGRLPNNKSKLNYL